MRGETNITSVLMGGVQRDIDGKSNTIVALVKDIGSMTIAAGNKYYQNDNADVSQTGYKIIAALSLVPSSAATKAVGTTSIRSVANSTVYATISTIDKNAASAAITDNHWIFTGLYEKI